MESLMFLPDFTKTTDAEQHIGKELGSSEVSQLPSAEKEVEGEVEVENVERPVDLYKVYTVTYSVWINLPFCMLNMCEFDCQ